MLQTKLALMKKLIICCKNKKVDEILVILILCLMRFFSPNDFVLKQGFSLNYKYYNKNNIL